MWMWEYSQYCLNHAPIHLKGYIWIILLVWGHIREGGVSDRRWGTICNVSIIYMMYEHFKNCFLIHKPNKFTKITKNCHCNCQSSHSFTWLLCPGLICPSCSYSKSLVWTEDTLALSLPLLILLTCVTSRYTIHVP